MLGFAIFASSLVIVGTALARTLWRKLDPAHVADTDAVERIAAGFVLGASAWIGLNWILALTSTLTPVLLWCGVASTVIAAALVLVRNRGVFALQPRPEITRTLLFLSPTCLWLSYVLWRGAILPPANHDALAYHLPKAVLLSRAHGYEHFASFDHRITNYPFNYELLLADVLLLTGHDTVTEWIGAWMFVALLVTTAAIARRWWRSGAVATLAPVIATATAPVLLLHSGADKNDLMVIWFTLAGILWGSRWTVRGGAMPFLLTVISIGMGVGTKTNAAAVAVALAPFLLYRAAREVRSRSIGIGAVAAAAAAVAIVFALGGGAHYLFTYLLERSRGAMVTVTGATTGAIGIAYGDWSNLWQVPYLLLTVPFSTNRAAVWVPWHGEYWFWPHYEIFFSHYGRLFTLLVLLLPAAYRAGRREIAAPAERTVALTTAVIAIAIMLPTELRPVGLFGALARYCAFIIPLVTCAVLPPLVAAAARRKRRLQSLIVAALAAVFVSEAIAVAINDRFSPLQYAMVAKDLPRGTRFVWFQSGRAGNVVDRLAGPDDTIAVDGAFDTWVYPAYGRDLTREVIFLPESATPAAIPAHVDWVMIDRSWNAIWGNPAFEHMGQFDEHIGRGAPTAEDTDLLMALLADDRFELVYRKRQHNQALFRRRSP